MSSRVSVRALVLLAICCLAPAFLSGTPVPPILTAVAPSGGPTWQAEGNFAGAEFGSAVAPAGDENHDGYSDIIVGSPGYDTLGRASVYLGSILGVAAQPAWTAYG